MTTYGSLQTDLTIKYSEIYMEFGSIKEALDQKNDSTMKLLPPGGIAVWRRSSLQGLWHLSSWVLDPCSCYFLPVSMFD
ncbi:Hypothetical predicted protein [Olea europaea subsp. europaea]|uniref:Uncharacterized protein n=1 Tax=Olea europaea subsp. europaea TaxID=158383 RepID=A0A8S0U3Z8_OLEEU|nr:Hypothetical predicted protein [Olea europaea subsp. europaea]